MSQKQKVIIRAPEQQQYRNPEALLDKSELQDWLNNLPLLKPTPTVRYLYEVIEAINLQEVPDNKRLQLLDLLYTTALKLFPSLNQTGLRRLSLKDQDLHQLKQQCNRVYTALADGYKIIVRNGLTNNTINKTEQYFLPVYRAMELLSLALLNSYRNYMSVPQHTYQDLHQLYMLSEHVDILDYEMDNNGMTLSAASIGNMYRQIMILAFLDPFRMSINLAEVIYDRLSRFAEYCSIMSLVPNPDSSEIFIVDLTTDEAPRAIYKVSSHKDLKMPRVFDMHPLKNKIKAEITMLESEESQNNQNECMILRHLFPPDKEQQTRKDERKESDRECKVTFGIDAVHQFLNLDKSTLTQILESDASSFGPHPLEQWDIGNESDSGFNLISQQTTYHDVRVGDIIGLLSETTASGNMQGRIAIIRWVRNIEEQKINIGVELIQGNILPASCRLIDGEDKNKTFAGIFISSASLKGSPATIITPKSIYRRGRILEVTIADQPMRIESGFLRDDSFTFDRFDFKSLQS